MAVCVTVQLAIDLAVGASSFLGYTVPEPLRTLLFLLEDDVMELRDKIAKQIEGWESSERIAVYTRDDLFEAGVTIAAREPEFRAFVESKACDFRPDLIVFDNLAHIVNADYNDSKTIHEFAAFVYGLAKKTNAAIITAKRSDQRRRWKVPD
jgi:RecA-family ATPase